MSSWPFWLIYVFLFLGSTARGQMLYWIGRLATDQTLKRGRPKGGRWQRVLAWGAGEGPQRGVRALRRWGLVMVPLGHLTIGFQSMINAGAGVLRISWLAFTIAQVPGSLAWAAIYSTIGFAVWGAIIRAAAGSPEGLVVVAAVVVLVVATALLHRRVSRRRAASVEAEVEVRQPGR